MSWLSSLFGFSKSNKYEWKELDFNKVPRWVKKAVSNSMPSPVSRPPHFSMKIRGKHFIYKLVYNEVSSKRIDETYYIKRRR